jgi:hypothetical protein
LEKLTEEINVAWANLMNFEYAQLDEIPLNKIHRPSTRKSKNSAEVPCSKAIESPLSIIKSAQVFPLRPFASRKTINRRWTNQDRN